MNQIMLMLGLNASGFFSGLKRASDEVKSFEKDWKALGKIAGAGGVLMLVVQFFQTVIDHARNSKDKLDENSAAVRRFADELDNQANQAKGWGVSVVGHFNRVGESIAAAAKLLLGFTSARDDFLEEKTGKDADAAVRRLEESKKHEQEFKQISADIKTNEERIKDLNIKKLSVQEQYNARENEYLALYVKRVNFEGDSLARRQLEQKISEARVKMVEAEVALEKEKSETEKKAFEEDLAWVKEHDRLMAEQKKLKYEALDDQGKLNQLQADEAALVAKINGLKQTGQDTLSAENALLEMQAEKRKVVQSIAEKTAEADKKGHEALAIQSELLVKNKKLAEDFIFAITNGGHTSQDIQGADAAALRELIRRNNIQIESIRQRGGVNPGGGPDIGEGMNLMRLQNENRRIQRELDTRERFRFNYETLGPDAARRAFGGDPLLFDRFVQEFVKGQSEQAKTNNLLGQIHDQLAGRADSGFASNLGNLNATISRGLTTIAEAARR